MAPSPSVFLAAVAQRTKTAALRAAGLHGNLYHPLRLIDEICMLDQMSGGRLELGIGRGISPYEVGYYGVDPATGPERFAEALEVILKGLDPRAARPSRQVLHLQGRADGDAAGAAAPSAAVVRRWRGPRGRAWAVSATRVNIVCNAPARAGARRSPTAIAGTGRRAASRRRRRAVHGHDAAPSSSPRATARRWR